MAPKTISSKYVGTYKGRGKKYNVGDPVVWVKGEKARHPQCAAAAPGNVVPISGPKTPMPPKPATPPAPTPEHATSLFDRYIGLALERLTQGHPDQWPSDRELAARAVNIAKEILVKRGKV